MKNNNKTEDNFEVLRRLHKNPNVYQRDLAYQLRATYSGHVSLKKAIDVLYGTKLYKDCELRAFTEVKKDDRADL